MARDLDEALAILITQLGGRKSKSLPISRIAKSATFAVRELGSAREVGERIKRSASQVNDFVAIDSLPSDVKDRYLDRRLIGIEVGSELSRLHDINRIREVARALVGVGARDGMQIVEYARRNPGLSATECRDRVLGSKNIDRKLDILVVPLNESDYEEFRSIAKRSRKGPVDLAKEIIEDWIAAKRVRPKR